MVVQLLNYSNILHFVHVHQEIIHDQLIFLLEQQYVIQMYEVEHMFHVVKH
jgi:hypothetical protein